MFWIKRYKLNIKNKKLKIEREIAYNDKRIQVMESTIQTEELSLNNIIPVGNDRCFLCGAKLSAEK